MKPIKNLSILPLYLCLFLSSSPLVFGAPGNPDEPCTVASQETDCLTSTTFLTCNPISLTCECKATENWETSACATKAGRTCKVATPQQPCSAFSTCEEASAGAGFKCTCQIGSTPEDGYCKSQLGGPCDETGVANPDCDASAHLMCTGEADSKTCDCKEGTTNVNFTCKANIDKSCTPEGGAGPVCDETSFLTCSAKTDGVCQCQEGSENVAGLCRARKGRDCTEDGVDWPLCDETSHLTCLPDDGKCDCAPGHVIVGPKCTAHLGDVCSGSSAQCDTTEFLACGATSQVCECNEDTVLEDGVCVGLLNTPCGAGVATNSPANCSTAALLTCDDTLKICACNPGLRENEDGQCRVKIGGDCDDDATTLPCDNLAQCTDQKCQCQQGLEENQSGQCRVPLGGTCDPDPVNGKPCDLAAICDNLKCTCNDTLGLVDNGKGLCRLIEYEDDCDAEQNVLCDEQRYLTCDEDQKCRCMPDHDHYNTTETDTKCLANLGDICDNTENPLRECDVSKFILCGADGVCGCRGGTADVAGVCVTNYNENCDKNGVDNPICDDTLFLTCQNNLCKCTTITIDVKGVCKAAFGKLCNTTNSPNVCAETNNLICRDNKCACMDEFPNVNELGQCNGAGRFGLGYFVVALVAIFSMLRL